jgi:single-stranded-DNA-specific exonuclease
MRWDKREIPPELITEMSAKYGCDPLIASILVRRGHTKGQDIQYFLEDDLRYLHNPFDLPGMEDAIDRILAAKEAGERILVFGDRDVDGITSTALVAGFLSEQGMEVQWRLPTGNEPYGLSIKAVEEFAAKNGTLIITVDCGISNIAEVKRAGELGIDVIITDHHNQQDEIPAALAIVNPKLAGSPYPFRDLAGCGVAYKFISALRFALKSELYGHQICLFNTRAANDAYIIEIARLRNLAVVDRLVETVVPGMVSMAQTRLPAFLSGQQILVWDGRLQRHILAKLFGSGFEIQLLDIAPEIGKELPQTVGKSLLRLRELSRFARYADKEFDELDVFINLFTSFTYKRERYFTEEDAAYLQLACLGTIADIMPLKNENRIIVRAGLASLQAKARPGLANLLFKLDFAGRRVSANDLSWSICPAINAAGRMGSPGKAAQLLLEKDAAIRETLSGELVAMNEERKKLGAEIWTLIEPQAAKNLPDFDNKIAVAYGKEIFRGVTGIMANRLVSFFKVPSLAASFNDQLITGSLRSPSGYANYDLTPLLEQCADLFIDWGGHDYAAGFSMEKANWEAFLQRLKQLACSIEFAKEKPEETVVIDAELPLSRLSPDILKIIDRFEPYGSANEQLTFLVRGVKVQDILFMGKNGANHVKLTLDTGKNKWAAVYWNAAERVKRDFDINDAIDLVFRITRNFYNGSETPQLMVIDLKRSSE